MSMDSFRGFSMFNPRNESIPIMKAKKYIKICPKPMETPPKSKLPPKHFSAYSPVDEV